MKVLFVGFILFLPLIFFVYWDPNKVHISHVFILSLTPLFIIYFWQFIHWEKNKQTNKQTPGCLLTRVFHRLDFTVCLHVGSCNIFICPLYLLDTG